MQHLLEVIFPYLILLYACDCISYLGTNHFLLTSWFGKKFQIKGSGFRLAGVLPTSRVVAIYRPDFYLTPEGVYVNSKVSAIGDRIPGTRDLDFITYGDLGGVQTEGKSIKINGIHPIKTPSSAIAKYQTEMIRELQHGSRSARKDKIAAWLKASCDLKAIEEIRSIHSRPLSIVTFLSSHLFLVLFLILPSVLYTDLSKYANIDVLLICIAVIYSLLLIGTFVTARRIYKHNRDTRLYILLAVIFSPVNTLHILGYLTRDLYFTFDYLALAANYLPRNCFKNFIRKEFLLMDRLESQVDRQDWRDLWTLKKELVRGLLKACGITPDEITAAPVKQDQSALAYCPYCLTEYSKKRHNCIDCNVALREFEADPQTAT
jgi:hypothetical protein